MNLDEPVSSQPETRLTVRVDADGKVTIPGTHPGETIMLLVQRAVPLWERTPEEREAMIAQILEEARQLRAETAPEDLARVLDHSWLYDEDGLPK